MTETALRVTVTRRFDASPERLFDAWLDPGTVGRFLFATPSGRMVRVELDPRIGGRFTIVERRGDRDATHYGTYLAIERPRRLAFGFSADPEQMPAPVTVEIAPVPEGCELTLVHEISPEWASFADRIRDSWTLMLRTLAGVLDAGPAGRI